MSDKRDSDSDFLPDEARLTSFGRKMRTTSMDEMPELCKYYQRRYVSHRFKTTACERYGLVWGSVFKREMILKLSSVRKNKGKTACFCGVPFIFVIDGKRLEIMTGLLYNIAVNIGCLTFYNRYYERTKIVTSLFFGYCRA